MASVKMPFVLSLLVILHFLAAISTALLKQDQSALLSLKSTMHDPSGMLASWNSSSRIPVCNWTGVTCSLRHHRVVSLNLSYVGLQGSIGPEIGNLSFLTYIDFRGNSLRGELPWEMMHLRRLKYLDVERNSLGGQVPSWLGYLPNIHVIDLSNNSFTGAVPASLFNASKLEYLRIRYNSLQGSIPSQISQNGNLRYLNLCGNRISGSLPRSLLNLTYLQVLDLTENSLSGNLPLNICSKIPNLLHIYLSANQLSGQISSVFRNCSQLLDVDMAVNHFDGVMPREIGNLTTLTKIFLGTNNFTGGIPSEIGNLLNLEVLNIQENVLTGEIPQEIGSLQKLIRLALSVNRLSGVIPLTILNMSSLTYFLVGSTDISGNIPHGLGLHQLRHLQVLALGGNSLSGVIPDSISNLTELTVLELSYNHLTGSIPLSLGTLTFLTRLNLEYNNLSVGSSVELSFLASVLNCSNLSEFYVSMNPLKGTFPSSIPFSSSLKVFHASFCEFEGNIPREMGNLSGLIEFNLGGNVNLDGALPIEFRNLLDLQMLDLNGNKFSGLIPNYFCEFKQLGILHLGENQFTGQVPECFQDMNSLRYLYLYSNKLDATLPPNLIGGLIDLLYLDVHSNSLRGDIPQGIGNMKAAIIIDLSNNSFSGLIPVSIGGLNNLINLSLSHNQLQGSIPEKLTNMLNLESLDLSHNNLTGHIPISLASLRQLKYFNISFNKLEGKIPSNGSFRDFPYESFMSNGAFCDGPPHLHLLPCAPSHSTQKSGSKMLHLLTHVMIPVSLAIILIAFGAIMCIKKRKKRKSSPSQIDERISFYELHRATNGFNESNLLASGSYGSVYKGVLRDGTLIATKVFNLEIEGSYKSFDRECEVLRNARHRNLVKVITNCSNLDFKALVLEYMHNGSLEKWLYSHNYFLDFLKRLDIMIDVASAVAYLHYGYSSTIVHCDLKPGNVLLDEDMIGRVCDFGIAKLFAGDESMARTNTLATFGYIAPEYGFEGKVSTSCDVYSFGILLMETFSRKKPTEEMFSGDWGLKEWVGESLRNSSTDFIDVNLMNVEDKIPKTLVQCVSEIMELALRCTIESVEDRCDIKLALEKLEKIKRHFTKIK